MADGQEGETPKRSERQKPGKTGVPEPDASWSIDGPREKQAKKATGTQDEEEQFVLTRVPAVLAPPQSGLTQH